MNLLIRRLLVRRWRQNRSRTSPRIFRDSSDPLAMHEALFIRYFGVTKQIFAYLCSAMKNKISAPRRQKADNIPMALKILTTLHFLAAGNYQNPRRCAWRVRISQPSVSRCINEVVETLNELLPQFVRFPRNKAERDKIKKGFYEKFRVPNVIGCIDGTLIAIVAPRHHPSEASFINRNGNHAINAGIICDSNSKIIGINARFGGAADDIDVWQNWPIRQHLRELYNSGETSWLLGDSEYPQQPWLMTPAPPADDDTPESYYSYIHEHAHACIEQCIGMLKSRWRCLQNDRGLHYKPEKCAKIINACAVLHNLCLHIEIDINLNKELNNNDAEETFIEDFDNSRQQLIDILWQNRSV